MKEILSINWGKIEKWSKICLLGKDSWIWIVHKTDSGIYLINSVIVTLGLIENLSPSLSLASLNEVAIYSAYLATVV